MSAGAKDAVPGGKIQKSVKYSKNFIQLISGSVSYTHLVFEYIETFYNTVRIHSHCGYLSPDEYEKQYRNKLLELEQKLAG